MCIEVQYIAAMKSLKTFIGIFAISTVLGTAAQAEVRSAHHAERWLKRSGVPEKRWLFNLATDQILPWDVQNLTVETLISQEMIQTARSRAKFKLVLRGAVADPSLGPGWMDERGYVWFDPVRVPYKKGILNKKGISNKRG